MMKQLKQDRSGMIVVEASISFMAMIIVCLGIVFLINLFMLHNTMQMAINSAAQEISSYSYLYQAFGLRAANQHIQQDGKDSVGDITETAEQVASALNSIQDAWNDTQSLPEAFESFDIATASNSISNIGQNLSDAKNSTENIINQAKGWIQNPSDLLYGMIHLGVQAADFKVKHLMGEGAATLLTKKYLPSGSAGADTYLQKFGVNGYNSLDFSGSSLFCEKDRNGNATNRLIDIVVEYDVDLSYLSFVLGDTSVHIVQRASIAAWVGGDDGTIPE